MQEIALRILSRFGSTCSCESAFSVMGALKSKTRNKLCDENLDRPLILAVNNFFEPQWSGLDRSNAQFRTRERPIKRLSFLPLSSLVNISTLK